MWAKGVLGRLRDLITYKVGRVLRLLTLLGAQPRFGDKLLIIRVIPPTNGTAVLKGLKGATYC